MRSSSFIHFILACAIAASHASPPALLATPAVVSSDGEAILVNWAGIAPVAGDFVSVSCGSSVSLDDYLEDSLGGRLDVNISLGKSGYVRTHPLINSMLPCIELWTLS